MGTGGAPAPSALHVASATGLGSAPAASAELADVVEEYCVRCHNERRLRGNLSLEEFDPSAAHLSAEVAEKMIETLRELTKPYFLRRDKKDITLKTLVAPRRAAPRPRRAPAPSLSFLAENERQTNVGLFIFCFVFSKAGLRQKKE